MPKPKLENGAQVVIKNTRDGLLKAKELKGKRHKLYRVVNPNTIDLATMKDDPELLKRIAAAHGVEE